MLHHSRCKYACAISAGHSMKKMIHARTQLIDTEISIERYLQILNKGKQSSIIRGDWKESHNKSSAR